jgi:hypothetical protein
VDIAMWERGYSDHPLLDTVGDWSPAHLNAALGAALEEELIAPMALPVSHEEAMVMVGRVSSPLSGQVGIFPLTSRAAGTRS